MYEAVSPFSAENGYELAGSYENGTTVQTYGGGICQVSTTLYNAVIRAELAIDERYCHSMIVGYVKPSMDAAIAGTYKDLKFTNNYDFPIYIEGYTSGMQITFTVYGEETRDAGREVIFESETTSTTEPKVKFELASDQPIGPDYVRTTQNSHTGYTAKLWKIVKENGVEVSREPYNNSTYNASPKIITVGIKSDNAEAVAAVKAAVATGDEAAVRAAAAANSADALKKQEEEEKKQQEEEQKKQEEEEQKKEETEKKPAKKEEADKPEKEPEEGAEE